MPNLLEAKTALILGVANKWSLAYAIAQAFHREGASLILTYQGERQKGTVAELAAGLGGAAIADCDVTKDEDLARLGEFVKAHGRLDAMVHSIAFANREDLSRPFVETSREGYLLAQNVSAYSMIALARLAAPLMTSGGSMMTLSYLGATRVVPNYNVMGVAKAALEACVRYLAFDLGPRNIRVNAISSGPVSTAAARGIAGFLKMEHLVAQSSPLRRKTDPAEVGATAAFLCSDAARGITGEVLHVDCGYNIMGTGTLAP